MVRDPKYSARRRRGAVLSGALFAAVAALSNGLSTPAAAQDLVSARDKFDWWATYVVDENGAKYCYIASEPTTSTASKDNIKRGSAYLMVSTFPDRNTSNEVSVVLGYPADSNRELTLKVGPAEFRLFNDGETAWFERPGQHNEAVTAMRAGAKAEVTATSTRGTTITDEFSLIGFTAALNKMSEYCK